MAQTSLGAVSTVTYEDLHDIEAQFDEIEAEIIRRQYELSRPIYEKRQRLVSQIQNFWPLVMEQAPPDIDEYIQPSDSALLLSSLTSLSVSRFEVDEGGSDGDPRSFAIRLEFAPNDYFEDTVLEKRFWYRHSPRESWSGLVSEPVDIRWKKGKDLTGGLLSLVKKSWEQEKAEAAAGGQRSKKNGAGLTPEQVALKNKIDATGLGGLSFFAWFGFRGKHITAEESRIAVEREREKRRLRAAAAAAAAETDGATSTTATTAVAVSTTLSNSEGELLSAPVDEDDDVDDMDLEIFPGGDDLALTIAEDLWPNAIKYFIQAQEQEPVSDEEFEEDEDEDDGPDSQGRGQSHDRPSKKLRS